MHAPARSTRVKARPAAFRSLLSATAFWTEKERRMTFAQIERLAALPVRSTFSNRAGSPRLGACHQSI